MAADSSPRLALFVVVMRDMGPVLSLIMQKLSITELLHVTCHVSCVTALAIFKTRISDV